MREIQPINNNGSIQLKFSVSGKRYSFNPIPGGQYDSKRDLSIAQAIATQIQNDILAKHFDPTLQSYRITPKVEKNKPTTLIELWDMWVTFLDLPEYTKANHYRWVRRMIAKVNPPLQDPTWFTKLTLAPRTYNDRLKMLRSCCGWGVAQGLIDSNPYEKVKLRKDMHHHPQPFTNEEIRLIIEGFDRLYPHYTPFVMFLLGTGVRTAEAIGLRWGHVDFTRSEVVISESMPKDLTGNGYRRIRKETKTGSIRYLHLTPELREMLLRIRPINHSPDDLVFTSPTGKAIAHDNWRRRQWVKVLEVQGIPYRKPYNTRHTLASHAIEQGISLTGVAYLMGHKDTSMVVKTYGHIVNRPDLPEMPLR